MRLIFLSVLAVLSLGLVIALRSESAIQEPARPQFVRIRGQVWHITYGTTAPADLGETICDMDEIRIVDHAPKDKEREVIVHELLHTSFCASDEAIAVLGVNPAIIPYNQEQAIRMMAPQVVDILKENPGLAAYLSEQ